MLHFGIFEACVLVDDVELSEYNVTTDDEAKTVTCWIPSEAGKAFSVKFGQIKDYPARLCGELLVDGISYDLWTLEDTNREPITISQVYTSATTWNELLFSPITLTDDDAFLHTTNVKDIGDIVIRICVFIPDEREGLPDIFPQMPIGIVHERSKKGIGHQVKLGPAQAVEPASTETIREIRCLAIFTFKYRPIDVLRADGIAPPDSLTSQVRHGKRKAKEEPDNNSEEDEDGGVDEEVAKAEEKLKILMADISDIQTKLSKKKSKKPKKKVKAKHHPPTLPGDVIDLT